MRYVHLWLQFLKMSWMSDMEYRLNFVVHIFGEIVWYTAQLSVFEVLYTHTSNLNGWTVQDMRVFMGSLFLADVMYMILFQTNLDGFARLVKRGELDLYLVKPISSQFMVSCRKINTSVVGNLLMVIGYFMWAVYKNDHVHLGWEVPGFIVLVMCGTLISYCMRFLFGMISVIFVDASNVQFIWYQLYRLGTRPDILYPNYLRYVIMTAIPVAFIASVPARFLIEGFNIKLSVLALTVTGLLMWVTSRCWRRVLRHYASASS